MTRFILVFIFFTILWLSFEFYVFKAFKGKLTQNKSKWLKGYYVTNWVLFILSCISLALMFIIGFSASQVVRNILMTVYIMNFIFKLNLSLFVFFDDIRRGSKWLFSKINKEYELAPEAPKMERSDFLLKTGTLVASAPVLGLSWGIISGAYDYRVRRKTILLPNLPRQFDGIKVAQISDVHSGSFFNKVAVEGGVDLLLQEKPDLVFFTGDLVNEDASEMAEYMKIFSKVKAPLGVNSVLGNHDYGMMSSRKEDINKNKKLVAQVHKELGWDLMLNTNRELKVDGESIGIIGVENWGDGFIKEGDLDLAYRGMEEMPTKLLLSHDPTHWSLIVQEQFKDIDLTLSGHTHGMQLGIETPNFRWSPASWRYKHWADLYEENNQYLYVNRGYGFIGYPGRLGILPEITILELKRGTIERF